MNSYIIEECEKVPIIRNWLGCEELRFVQILTDNEQNKCQTSSGLLEVLSKKFKSQHIETMLSQYCRLIRVEKESAGEWLGCLRVNAYECKYKETGG